MCNEDLVLCASNAYEQKYFLNKKFENLPEGIKDELKIMCVLFTEDIGGILSLVFDEEGNLYLSTDADENDLLYDDIGSGLKVKQLQYEKAELLESLEKYYKAMFLGMPVDFEE